MGGSINPAWFGFGPGFGQEQQQFTPKEYSNQQMLDYARQNGVDYNMGQQYQDAIKNQLRNGTYKTPEGVWSQVRNANDKAAFDKAQRQLYILPSNGQSDANPIHPGG